MSRLARSLCRAATAATPPALSTSAQELSLNFASDFTLAAASAVSGAGGINFSNGTTNIAGTYNVTGTSSFSGATVNFNSAISSLGTGPLNISSGAVNFNSNNITVAAINLSGGTLGGTVASVTASGLLSWTGGTMSGSE